MADLVEFLKARLDEDEQAAREYLEVIEEHQRWSAANPGAQSVALFNFTLPRGAGHPARALAEVEAKRGLLALHSPGSMGTDEGEPFRRCRGEDWVEWPCRNVRLLASVYTDHPDYDSAWRV